MTKTKCSAGGIELILCTALLGALTGCASYVDQPRARGGYYPEAPATREVVYVQPPAVQVEVSDGSVGVSIRTESDFYEPLTPYGRWQVVGSYGRCWIPGRVEADWRPYSEGYWQRTDDGWYWVSEEPWAWATYHYGCWNLSPEYGWYWVPQTQWAPAWVSWHSGGGYIGWTPRYPSGVREISPRAYVFVEERHFMEPVRRSTVVVNNTTIINTTVINQAPSTTVIEKASGRKVQALPAQELRHKAEAAAVAAQRTPQVSTGERKIQPARSEAQPAERKPVVAPTPPQLERPAAAVYRPVAPAPKNFEAQPQKPKPVFATTKSEPAVESAVQPQVRPQGNHPAAVKEPSAPNSSQPAKKQAKPAKASEKKMQQPVSERPSASPNNEPNTADKNHENKAKE
jgi:hypothetical protein